MRNLLTVILCVLPGLFLEAQNVSGNMEGSVTYVASQNVYVKFSSTAGIKAGDTLYLQQGQKLVPALVVKELSSISCVCVPLSDYKYTVSEKVYYTGRRMQDAGGKPQAAVVVPMAAGGKPQEAGNKPQDAGSGMQVTGTADTLAPGRVKRQQIHGFAAVASYTNFSNTPAANNERMKYTFSLLAGNIGNTNLSAECYATFVHSNQNWNEIQQNLWNGLKVYNLNFSYDFGTKASILLGRKINPKLSNMGANDGLMFELKFKPVSVGIIAGFRPDFDDYSFNANLFQFGGYLYNEYRTKKGYMQSTLAFIDQTNNWNTDRMFMYLQHVNALLRNLTFFGSAELDLYGKTLQPDSTFVTNHTPKLSNLYVSLNYRPWRKLTLTASYSARQNVIYYETYKNFLDRLLDTETLQGYLLQVNYRPVKRLTVGATGAYRFQKNDPKPTQNVYAYVTYSQVPGIECAVTGSYMYLQTSWTSGNIYSLGLSRDFFKGKFGVSANYRYVSYTFSTSESPLPQNVIEGDLTWRIIRRLALSVFYEGTFENVDQFNRIYAQVNFRF